MKYEGFIYLLASRRKKKIEPKVFLTVDKISEDVQLEKKKNQLEESQTKIFTFMEIRTLGEWFCAMRVPLEDTRCTLMLLLGLSGKKVQPGLTCQKPKSQYQHLFFFFLNPFSESIF